MQHSVSGVSVLWRHEHADHGRRAAGYDAPDGIASADAALRWLFEEGPTSAVRVLPAEVASAVTDYGLCLDDHFKSERDLEAMRPACAVAGTVLNEVAAFIQPGVTTREVDEFAATRIKHYGAKSAFLGISQKYPCHICISVNEQVVHGLAGPRVLRFGDIVSLDVGVVYNGFIGDTARTVAVGGCGVLAQKLMDVTEKALYEGIAQAVRETGGGHIARHPELCRRQWF